MDQISSSTQSSTALQTKYQYTQEMSSMIKKTNSIITRFTKATPKTSETPTNFTFSLPCSLVSKEKIQSLQIFIVQIAIYETVIKIKIFFTVRNEPYKFIDPNLKEKALIMISIINADLKLGYFNIVGKNQFLQLELALRYHQLDSLDIENIMMVYIKKAILIYNENAHQFYFLIENTNNALDPNVKSKFNSNSQGKQDKSNIESSSSDSEEENSTYEQDSSANSNSASSNAEARTSYSLVQDLIISDQFLRLHFENEKPNPTCPEFIYMKLYNFLEINEMPEKLLEEIFYTLIKMYENFLEFFSFPAQNIVIYGTEQDNYNFCFISDNINKVARIRDREEYEFVNSKDYERKLRWWYAIMLSKILDIYYKPCYEISESDMIPPSDFKDPNLMDEEKHIGQGGFGDVYQNELHGMKVAIKFAREVKEENGKALFRLQKELVIMKSLCHENLVKCYGCVKMGEKLGLVLEYCSNGTLSSFIKTQPKADLKLRLDRLYGVIKGLEFMHCKSICHFDIKPQNIFFDENNIPKIADFGMSEYLNEWTKVSPGFTLHYCSPEQIEGKNPTQKADIWSYGMTTYAVIIRRSPFDYLKNNKELEANEFCQKLKADERPEIPEMMQSKLPQIVSLMVHTWDTNPEGRPSAREIRLTIEKWLACFNTKRN